MLMHLLRVCSLHRTVSQCPLRPGYMIPDQDPTYVICYIGLQEGRELRTGDKFHEAENGASVAAKSVGHCHPVLQIH